MEPFLIWAVLSAASVVLAAIYWIVQSNKPAIMKIAAVKPRTWASFGIAIGAAFWFVFIWPTPFRYFKEGSRNVRVNRFTGHASYLYGGRWTP